MNKKMAIFLIVLLAVAMCPWSIVPRILFLAVAFTLLHSIILGNCGIEQVILRSEVIRIGEHDLYKNDAYIFLKGCRIAFVIQYQGEPVIFIDKHFLRLTDNAQWFTIHHELEHVRNGDCFASTTMEERRALVKNGKVLDAELKADLAAAKELGVAKAIEALKEIKTTVSGVSTVEFDLRIAALASTL